MNCLVEQFGLCQYLLGFLVLELFPPFFLLLMKFREGSLAALLDILQLGFDIPQLGLEILLGRLDLVHRGLVLVFRQVEKHLFLFVVRLHRRRLGGLCRIHAMLERVQLRFLPGSVIVVR